MTTNDLSAVQASAINDLGGATAVMIALEELRSEAHALPIHKEIQGPVCNA